MVQEATIAIDGMSCASCVAHVGKAARAVGGVDAVEVNLAAGRARVRFDPAKTDARQIAAAISDSGYSAEPQSPGAAGQREDSRLQKQDSAARHWLARAVVGFMLWLPVELTHWALRIFYPNSHQAHARLNEIAFLTATVAMIYVGGSFFKSAWSAFRHRTSNMDTLIALGAGTAYGYSLIFFLGGLLHRWPAPMPDQLYFMESSALLSLISLGHYLEARARRLAGSAIRQLLNLSPASALRLPDIAAAPQEVAVADLHVGDLVLIRPGDRVPVDGVVVEGSSSVDQSMITGEPLPILRESGQAVIGGTINVDGRLIVRASKIGADSALAQIVQLVESAQSSRPPIQRLADRIASVFVPTVLGIALLTAVGWVAWGWTHHWTDAATCAAVARAACSVLLIACPCALGLAVPAALMVGTGRAAQHGILIRDIDALQQAARIGVIALDKTGTITLGKPAIVEIVCNDGVGEVELLRQAAALEQFSSHPLARAITESARARGISIPQPIEFGAEAGLGVWGQVDGRSLLVGSRAMLERRGLVLNTSENQRTQIYVAAGSDGRFETIGRFIVVDPIKEDSIAAIAELKRMNLRPVMLSGDVVAVAEVVAKAVGIDEVHAAATPADKAAIISQLRSKGQLVAMVGDGINDAPALAAADLGIAIGGGSDVAREAGGIVLVGASLHGVAAAARISRATMKKIRQNLFLAFIYNVLAIPLAAFGFLTPLIAAAAMALSDLCVIGNALLLRRAKIDASTGRFRN